jgi:hypothetical protein
MIPLPYEYTLCLIYEQYSEPHNLLTQIRNIDIFKAK